MTSQESNNIGTSSGSTSNASTRSNSSSTEKDPGQKHNGNSGGRKFIIPSLQSAINQNTTVDVPLLFNQRKEKEKEKLAKQKAKANTQSSPAMISVNGNSISSSTSSNRSIESGRKGGPRSVQEYQYSVYSNTHSSVNTSTSTSTNTNTSTSTNLSLPPIRIRSSDGKAMVDGGKGPPLRYQPGLTPIENVMGSHIGVNKRQQGNPILKHIKHAPTTVIDMIPDYLLGPYSCALFISIRYHLLFPNYLIRRIKELKSDYRLRIVLCLVDVEDSENPLLEINRMTILHECTLLLAWSIEEAARYLETYKVYEKKGPTSIMERIDTDIISQTTEVVTSIRSVNKTDVKTLISTFGSLRSIVNTPLEKLKDCPGLGEKKVRRLYEAFHTPFYSNRRSKSNNGKGRTTGDEKNNDKSKNFNWEENEEADKEGDHDEKKDEEEQKEDDAESILVEEGWDNDGGSEKEKQKRNQRKALAEDDEDFQQLLEEEEEIEKEKQEQKEKQGKEKEKEREEEKEIIARVLARQKEDEASDSESESEFEYNRKRKRKRNEEKKSNAEKKEREKQKQRLKQRHYIRDDSVSVDDDDFIDDELLMELDRLENEDNLG